MYQFILLIHVFIAICIVALVLVQQGKGATMGAAFGSGASQTVFGSRGSGSFLFRLTITFAVLFFSTSIFLNYVATRSYKQQAVASALQNLPIRTTKPVTPVKSIPTTTPITHTESKGASGTTPALPAEIPARK